MNFINLSSGVAWLRDDDIKDYSFIRIQSTACEQKRWSFILTELDYNFYIPLARGDDCFVYDTSAKKEVSRAIYQGLPWIKYACSRAWDLVPENPYVKDCNVSSYFSEQYHGLSSEAKTKLKYVRKFVNTKKLWLMGHCYNSDIDGNYDEIVRVVTQ